MADADETQASAPEPMRWPKEEHPRAIKLWSQNVMQDVRISRGAIRVAWGLTFYLHSVDNRAFPSRQKLAIDVGLSEDRVRGCLTELRQLGHLLEGKENTRRGRLTVWRPLFNRAVEQQAPRVRKGGRKSIERQSGSPRDPIERQSETGLTFNQKSRLNVNHSIYEVRSNRDHSGVPGAITGVPVGAYAEPESDDGFEDPYDQLPF